MTRIYRRWALTCILLAGCLLPLAGRTAEQQKRPDSWAVKLERPGLPNLHKIDDGLYRGAQPTAEGIKELEKLGVRTIINLRSSHSDKDLIGTSKIDYVEMPLYPWSIDGKDVARFLRIATDKNRRPVFFHCQHGADRTGTMCAAYRVVVQGWTKQQAVKEMTQGGFGYHPIWQNLPRLIEKLDVDKVNAGMKQTQK